jgi:nitroreductase
VIVIPDDESPQDRLSYGSDGNTSRLAEDQDPENTRNPSAEPPKTLCRSAGSSAEIQASCKFAGRARYVPVRADDHGRVRSLTGSSPTRRRSAKSPAALFCYIDRDMGLPQWADVGMYLQTVMLLLHTEGLDSCPQMAWSMYRRIVAEVRSPPDELILFWGMSIGFEDVTPGYVRWSRASVLR